MPAKRMSEMTDDEIADTIASLESRPDKSKKAERYLGLLQAEHAQRRRPQGPPEGTRPRTRAEWEERLLAAKDPRHHAHAYLLRAIKYARSGDALRYPATHRRMLWTGEIPPRSEAELDIANGPDTDTGPAIPMPEHIRMRLAGSRAGQATRSTTSPLDQCLTNIRDLAERAGHLSPAQGDFIKRSTGQG